MDRITQISPCIQLTGIQLTRPICSIDVESTGTDPVKDRVVSLAIFKIWPDRHFLDFYWLVNPGQPIPADSTKIHGITDEMVKDKPRFNHADIAGSLVTITAGCDIVTYNGRKFDIPILMEELARIKYPVYSWPASDTKIIDACVIFQKKEPRNLEAASKKFTNSDHADAHNSLADAVKTAEVLGGEIEMYPDIGSTVDQLAAYSTPENAVDFAGKLYRDSDGDVRYSIGKAKDVKIKNDPGFGRWMLDKDFTSDTKNCVRAELARLGTKRFGPSNRL
jgi:DNA polymerase-3 subunit epsilon